MSIRNATISDIDELVSLFDSYRGFYGKSSDVRSAKEFLSERLNNKDSVIYVAESENNLVGFVQLYPIFSSTRMKKMWLLNDLFVNSNYRGKGIAIKLIEEARKLVRNTSACSMVLETEKTNNIGNNLYPKMGFQLNTDCNFYEWHNN